MIEFTYDIIGIGVRPHKVFYQIESEFCCSWQQIAPIGLLFGKMHFLQLFLIGYISYLQVREEEAVFFYPTTIKYIRT